MWAPKPKDANGQRRDINESLRWIESCERLTHREVSTSAQIVELIEWYRARWKIEMFFHVLKNGCWVEALQLALEAIERALTLFMMVSWRIARLMRLMRLGRTCPELPASLRFDPDEIRAAHVLTNKAMPNELPSLNDRVRRVAMLGGFLARQGDGEPGVKTLWIGLQRVTDFAAGVRFMRLSGDTLGCVSWDGFKPAAKLVSSTPVIKVKSCKDES